MSMRVRRRVRYPAEAEENWSKSLFVFCFVPFMSVFFFVLETLYYYLLTLPLVLKN